MATNSALGAFESRDAALRSDVTQLSSGLRVNTVADDPAGYAIATSLQSRVTGYQAGVENTQSATNAATVAAAALHSIVDVLQRLRSLAVEASNDILSSVQRDALQTEANQLVAEINGIVGRTNFNGTPLIDGSNALALLASLSPLLPGSSVAGPALANASFETPNVGSGTFGAFRYDPSGAGWTFNARSGITGINSGFSSGAPAPTNGVQEGFIQSVGTTNGSISQQVTLQAGVQYTVTFDATQRTNYQHGGQTVLVELDGALIARVFPQSGAYNSYTTQAFTAAAGTHTLTFVGENPSGQDNTAFIDNVKIQGKVLSLSGPAIADASFEQTAIDSAYSFGAFQYAPTGTGWLYSGSAGVSANQSGFTNGNPGAPDGGQVGFIQELGSIQQAVSGFQSGVKYVLEFDAANRGSSPGRKTQTLQISIDNTVIGTFTPTSVNYQAFSTAVFSPGAGIHVLKIAGLNPYGNDETAFIDSLHLYASAAAQSTDATVAVNSTGAEGQTVALSLPDAHTYALGVGTVDLSSFDAAQTAIAQIDGALTIATGAEASLGAQVIALGSEAANGAIATTNLTAAESNIRDLNVAAAVTQFTRDKVLQRVVGSVLTQANADRKLVLTLFAGGAKG